MYVPDLAPAAAAVVANPLGWFGPGVTKICPGRWLRFSRAAADCVPADAILGEKHGLQDRDHGHRRGGAYAGAHMARAGEDVTFIDPWPANVETMRAKGLKVSHIGECRNGPPPVRALHLTDLQQLAKESRSTSPSSA